MSDLQDTCASLLEAFREADELRNRLLTHCAKLKQASNGAAAALRGTQNPLGARQTAQALDAAAAHCAAAAQLIGAAEAAANQFVQRAVGGSSGGGAGGATDGSADNAGQAAARAGGPEIPAGSGLTVSRTQSGGFNLLPASDPAGQLAAGVDGKSGFTDVVVHGNAQSVGTRDGPAVSGEQLGDLIASIPAYDGSAIRLLACSAGKDDDGPAQRLADRLGVTVLAATDTVHLRGRADGTVRMSVGPNRHTPTGEWRTFEPANRKI